MFQVILYSKNWICEISARCNYQIFHRPHRNIRTYCPFRKHKMLGGLPGIHRIERHLEVFIFFFFKSTFPLSFTSHGFVFRTFGHPHAARSWYLISWKIHDIFLMESIVDRSYLRFGNVTGCQLQLLQNLKWWSYICRSFFFS